MQPLSMGVTSRTHNPRIIRSLGESSRNRKLSKSSTGSDPVPIGVTSRFHSRTYLPALGQYTARLLRDARAMPPAISGVIVISRTATFESSTRYCSTSVVLCGGLKFHCWRTLSRNWLSRSEDHRSTNSCVRLVSFSSNTSEMHLIVCGRSKISRIV